MSPKRYAIWQALRRVKWRLDSVLDRFGYKLERKGPGFSFLGQLLYDRVTSSAKEIVFVQIGANDGVSFDPLHPLISKFPHRFRGLVVEPLKDKFELLKRTYANTSSVIPVNVAVHNTESEMLIHRVRPEIEKTLGPWAKGIGSFNPEHHKRSDLNASHMTAEKVTCVTFDELLMAHGMTNVELLITDTEGYDHELIRGIDLTRHRPTYLHFEHGLPGGLMTWDDYKQLVKHLARYGYSICHEAHDATAFLPEALGSGKII